MKVAFSLTDSLFTRLSSCILVFVFVTAFAQITVSQAQNPFRGQAIQRLDPFGGNDDPFSPGLPPPPPLNVPQGDQEATEAEKDEDDEPVAAVIPPKAAKKLSLIHI